MLKGDLVTTPLPAVLRQLADGVVSGCLHVNDGVGGEAKVFLRGGQVYAVQVPGRRPQLGARLVSSGALGPEALAEALEAQRTELQGWRLGELLVHLGFVDQPVVEDFVNEQVREQASDLMRWPTGTWKFRVNERTREDVAPPRTVEELLADVETRMAQWQEITEVLHGPDAVPMLSAAGQTDAEMAIDPEAWSLLCKVDGVRSVSELARECGFTLFEAGQVVYSLVRSGLLEVEEVLVGPETSPSPEAPRADDVTSRLAAAFAPSEPAVVIPAQAEEPSASDVANMIALALREDRSLEGPPSAPEDDIDASVGRVSQALSALLGDDPHTQDDLFAAPTTRPRAKGRPEKPKTASELDREKKQAARAEASAKRRARDAEELAQAQAELEADRAAELETASAQLAADHEAEVFNLAAARQASEERAAAEAELRAQAEAERLAAEEAAAEAARIAEEVAAAEAERLAAEEAAAEAARIAEEEAERLAAEEAAAERARAEEELRAAAEAERLAAEEAAAEAARIAEEEAAAAAEAARLAEEEELARVAAEQAASEERAAVEAELRAQAEAEAAAEEAARVAAETEELARVAAEQAASEERARVEEELRAAAAAEQLAAAEAQRLVEQEAQRVADELAAAEEQERLEAEQADQARSAEQRAHAADAFAELSATAASSGDTMVEMAVETTVETVVEDDLEDLDEDDSPMPSYPPADTDMASLFRELSSLGLEDEPAAPAAPTRPAPSRPAPSAAANGKQKKKGLFGR